MPSRGSPTSSQRSGPGSGAVDTSSGNSRQISLRSGFALAIGIPTLWEMKTRAADPFTQQNSSHCTNLFRNGESGHPTGLRSVRPEHGRPGDPPGLGALPDAANRLEQQSLANYANLF